MVAPPFVRVPPNGYGGTELIIADLAAVYAASGHEVTLFASGDSRVDGCETRWLFRQAIWPIDPVAEWNHAAFAANEIASGDFDIVHSHTPAMLPLVETLSVPVVHTIHLAATPQLIDLYAAQPHAHYVCISARQAELLRGAFAHAPTVIHHGLDTSRFPAGDGRTGEALFLGRLDEVKAPDLALRSARQAGVKLQIAGKPHDGDYFRRVLSPELAKGGARLVGELCGAEKTRAIGEASALIFSSTWEEPFGLALIESMLCGTPVAALRRGAVAEVVEDGLTGYTADSPEELPAALEAAMQLDRARVRRRALERFNVSRMAASYLQAYESALSDSGEPILLRG